MEIRGRAIFQLFKQNCHVSEGSGQILGLRPSPAVTDCYSAEISHVVITYLGDCLTFLSTIQLSVFCGSAVVSPVSVPVPGSTWEIFVERVNLEISDLVKLVKLERRRTGYGSEDVGGSDGPDRSVQCTGEWGTRLKLSQVGHFKIGSVMLRFLKGTGSSRG